MVDWQEIHPDFTEELQQEWEGWGFTFEIAQEWINTGLIKPTDIGYILWLKNWVQKTPLDISAEQILRKQYEELLIQHPNFVYVPSNYVKIVPLEKKTSFEEAEEISENEETTGVKKWLKSQEKYNSKEKRKRIIKLDISNKGLKGDLDLRDFVNLEELDCNSNELTSLNLSNLVHLRKIDCSYNEITDLGTIGLSNLEYFNCSNNCLTKIDLLLLGLNSEKLKELDLSINNFSTGSLDPFRKFVNLEWLDISSSSRSSDFSYFGQICESQINHFHGSLKPLEKLEKLTHLSIKNTDIDNGLKFLPNSLKSFECHDDDSEGTKESYYSKAAELYYEELLDFDGNFQTWKEFYRGSAQEWLDENYPKNGFCELKEDEENYGKRRGQIVNLIISGRSDPSLEGAINLRRFTNLKYLDCNDNRLYKIDLKHCRNLNILNCSSNRLTELNLFHCLNLSELNCKNNKLTELSLDNCQELVKIDFTNNELKNLNFLEHISGSNRNDNLSILEIQNNQSFPPQNLKILSSFKNLKKLNISNCPFQGSLKPLENLEKLEELYISSTNISEGLEDLPLSCKKIYCKLDYGYKSLEIIKELGKVSREGEGKYNLDKWRTNKQNNMIASIIPLERLYVIRGNVKHFASKWGIKEGRKLSELSKLQNPKEINSYWYLGEGGQWTARATAVGGGLLATTVNPVLGGILATISPLVEVGASQMKERIYETREKRWSDFLEDADMFLDNYHELLGILAPIEIDELKEGGVSEAVKILSKKTEEFLSMYDEDKNREIDIEELIKERKKLSKDLNKGEEESKLWGIVNAMKNLENEIIEYRKFSHYGMVEKKNQEEIEKANDQHDKIEKIIQDSTTQLQSPRIKNLGDKTDEFAGKFTLCHLCNLTKEYLNKRETKANEQTKENNQLIAQIEQPSK